MISARPRSDSRECQQRSREMTNVFPLDTVVVVVRLILVVVVTVDGFVNIEGLICCS